MIELGCKQFPSTAEIVNFNIYKFRLNKKR